MKTKNTSLIVSGIFMIIAAWGGIACAVLIFISRLSDSDATLFLTLCSFAAAIIWAFINLYIGLASVLSRKKKKQLKKFFALGIFSIILFIFQSILCAANGIYVIHLLISTVCGFIIPCIYIFICRSKM